MTAYDVTVSREDNLWVAVVTDLPTGVTDVVHFADLEVEVRDLIAGLTDANPDDFVVNWHYEVGGHDITEQLHRIAALEEELRMVMDARDKARVEAASTLVNAGISQRATAEVLSLSHQRVSQLLSN